MDRPFILIVDDEPLIATLIEAAFEDAGFETCAVFDGKAAVEQLDLAEGRVAAVVTDVRMGDEINGWAVAVEARRRSAFIPVVYVTGDSGSDWSVHGVPGSVLIQKPFVGQQIVAAVMTLMNAQS